MDQDISPKQNRPSPAMLPSSLAAVRASREKLRCISNELQEEFDKLSRKVEPERDPGEDRVEPDARASRELATLGIEVAKKKKEELLLERQIIIQERDENLILPKIAAKRLQDTDRRYLSAGEELWKHKAKKARLDDPGVIRFLDPVSGGLSDCLLALYKKSDGLEKTKKRPSAWRQNALAYYDGRGTEEDSIWCHVCGDWMKSSAVKAAHVVPFFLDSDEIGEILFGNRSPSLRRAGNALLLSTQIKKWFDAYHIVIVPVDRKESPVVRWQVEVISSDIQNSRYLDMGPYYGKDLHQKELTFRNEKRPVPRFMYFHFLMSLIRIKDVKRKGWEEVWAKYYREKPFPTPGNYMRQSMLIALAMHFGTVDMAIIDSWIADNGFDTPLKLTPEESAEAARRVHAAAERAMARADRKPKSDDSDEDSNEDSDEDNEEEEEEEEEDGTRMEQ
ncbi:hypothetical protein OQA88_5436 [Cercophora sp. LCS_1]